VADYTPIFVPSKVIPLTASGTITGGDPLEVSGSGTVRKCTTALSFAYIGVAGNDAAANGRVTVYARGYVHESVAEGTVTAGDQLNTSAAAGRQVITAAATAGSPAKADVDRVRAIIGVALTTAADNAKVRWMEF
jgi:Uncharacterized conserved protein (DUF2190)